MNKVILTGRLTADPEVRYTQSATAVCRFTLAVDRYMGEGKESQADFIICTAWGKTAEHVGKYYFKGKKALVEGNIKTGSYDDKDGKKVYTTEVWVDRVEFADDKKKENQSQPGYTALDEIPPWESPSVSPAPAPVSVSVPNQQSAVQTNNSNPPWLR
jgi:single-strand DNA-binding protein